MVKILLFEVGIVVFLSINCSRTPPRVSIPSVNGVTSSKTISLVTSPAIIPACIAAPNATASIGSTPDSASFPISEPTNFLTRGILVGPPISTIFDISDPESLESSKALSTDGRHRSTIGLMSSSSFALVNFISRFWVPEEGSWEINGKLMSVSITVDSSILAFSAASLIRVMAVVSFVKSIPVFFLKSSTTKSRITLSISVPPNWVSPEVLITSKTPPPISIIVTSNVPPPKSKIRIFMSSWDLFMPYAREAAVGSLIIRTTSKPAIVPASFVACR